MPTYLITTFVILAVGGILNAGYLTYHEVRKKPLICPLDHDCSYVTQSKWSRVFGVRNEVLGLLFYLGNLSIMIVSLSAAHLAPELYFLLLVMNAGGFLFSLFLVWVQFFVLKDYCFYCMVSALISTLIFINSIALFLARDNLIFL